MNTKLSFSPPSYDEAIISPKGVVAPPINQYPPPASIYPYLKPENQSPPGVENQSPPVEESPVTPLSESQSADDNSSSKTGNISSHKNENISPHKNGNIPPPKAGNMPPPTGRLSPSQDRRRHQLHESGESGSQVRFLVFILNVIGKKNYKKYTLVCIF